MTTGLDLGLLPTCEITLADLADPQALAGAVRDHDARRAAGVPPTLWQITVETGDDPVFGQVPVVWLDAGVDGTRGALRWVDRTGAHLPTPAGQDGHPGPDRTWPRWLDFSGYACTLPPRLLVPAVTALDAIAELAATGRRPDGPSWHPTPWEQAANGPDQP